MFSKEDWAAVMDSEVFRAYASSELTKRNITKKEVDKKEALENFASLEDRIKTTPRLKATFKKLKDVFANNPRFAEKVDPGFVEGVLLLNLDDEDK
jgi:hypothetical protein